jgi:hypothetical protein
LVRLLPKTALLDGEIFYTLAEARVIVESWRRFYNTLRLHGSLGYRTPSPGGLHSAVRAGGCATPTGFAARAGVEAAHALTFNPGHSLGAYHSAYLRPRRCVACGFNKGRHT